MGVILFVMRAEGDCPQVNTGKFGNHYILLRVSDQTLAALCYDQFVAICLAGDVSQKANTGHGCKDYVFIV